MGISPRHPVPQLALRRGERGMALITGIMLLLLVSSLLAGFLTVVTADSRLRGIDRSRTQSFYAAYAGLEKLTADLGNLFLSDFSPEPDEVIALQDETPPLPGVLYAAPDGLGYSITFTPDAAGNPLAVTRTITSGPFEGLRGLVTSYALTTTARMPDGAESRVTRDVNTVSIPVFQFGIFSETDVTFAANNTFNFGGRVHTNGSLWLNAASGGTTTLTDRVTVVRNIYRTHLANTRLNDGTHEGVVNVARAAGSTRPMSESEGSMLSLTAANPDWTNISIGTYNGFIRTGDTGAKRLNLPLVSLGAQPIDLIRRPLPGEDPMLTEQRLFAQASIRILLSDQANRITDLPGVTPGTTPLVAGAQWGPVGNQVPLGTTFAANTTVATNVGYLTPVAAPVQSGFLKVEYRNAAGDWTDVTTEWLNLGYSKRNIDALNGTAARCAESPAHTANAIIRIQRMKETPLTNPPCGTRTAGPANVGNSDLNATATDYWPLTFYDVREAYQRDNLSTDEETAAGREIYLGGVMHYIELDVNNLRRWLLGQIGLSGPAVVEEDGYTVYFSDRRGNRTLAGAETGEYGFEDVVNPASASGTPNGALDGGAGAFPNGYEDANDNGVLDNYGYTAPMPAFGWNANAALTPYLPGANARSLITGVCRPAGPAPGVPCAGATTIAAGIEIRNKARANPPLLFRRVLRVTNGALGNLPADGLTIASENPVYVEGNYNANTAAFGAGSVPAAIMADAITILSETWRQPAQVAQTGGGGTILQWFAHGDTRSFNDPNDPDSRPAGTTKFRFAALSGKQKAFPQLGTPASFGTDGGVHNFLHLLEDWANGSTLHYMGSVASFFHSRQAMGLYRCCTNVYNLPARNFSFDVNFLTPALLPPKTPMFRDVNTTRFRHVTR
jgi:hypothetical protein